MSVYYEREIWFLCCEIVLISSHLCLTCLLNFAGLGSHRTDSLIGVQSRKVTMIEVQRHGWQEVG